MLKISLCIRKVSNICRLGCIDFIHAGVISGRSAIFCVSEIRSSILKESAEKLSIHNVAEKDKIILLDFETHLNLLANKILLPFLTDTNLPRTVVVLELIPVIFDILNELSKSRRISGTAIAQLFNKIFSSVWGLSSVLPITNLLADVLQHMRHRHFRLLQVSQSCNHSVSYFLVQMNDLFLYAGSSSFGCFSDWN